MLRLQCRQEFICLFLLWHFVLEPEYVSTLNLLLVLESFYSLGICWASEVENGSVVSFLCTRLCLNVSLTPIYVLDQ